MGTDGYTLGDLAAKPVELYTKDGQPTGVSYCSSCKKVPFVDGCCAPRKCIECGRVFGDPHYTMCSACRTRRREKVRQNRWEMAAKIPSAEWHGPVVTDDSEGPRDGYWTSICDLEDWLYDNELTYADVRVYATKKVPMSCDTDRLIEWMCEDQYEGAYDDIHPESFRELHNMLKQWCDANGTTTWVMDDTRAIDFGASRGDRKV